MSKLQAKLEELIGQLRQAEALTLKLQGAIEFTRGLIQEEEAGKKEDKKDEKGVAKKTK
tara:strand:+ start:358 stop:534 length:177 start_codon:yes stop_codon:yes gene_type:complete